MRKRTLILLVLVALLTCTLTACGSTSAADVDNAALEMGNFKTIDINESLVYNLDTRVVYYMFGTCKIVGNAGSGYSYFAPYISENGKFCRYINDEIVEITSEEIQ